MKITSFLAVSLSSLASYSLSSKRVNVLTCAPTSSCATYSATSIWFVAMSGTACPSLTLPLPVELATATPSDHPESCYYPATINYCQMGQYTNLIIPMSIIATAIYNGQSSGAIVCGRTKTANLPTFVAHTPAATMTIPSQITVTAQQVC
ncbi:uncharacterized protein PV09_09716 [Verruconis gallopava]|uniref:Hydrophobin n=1 Tax=Verruconis gallopava TaxID=253628 RepID=A0A0D1YCS8_9PEZI|nr:uncharacterized protein PV09_09716 [Verruconis gallopava]KIV98471.1 hypothetical protein PV09_09716 [Verruconis gallopava]